MLIGHAQEVHADLILLLTKHRSFVENLRHKSVTKKAILYSKIPLMILHPEDVGHEISSLAGNGEHVKAHF